MSTMLVLFQNIINTKQRNNVNIIRMHTNGMGLDSEISYIGHLNNL